MWGCASVFWLVAIKLGESMYRLAADENFNGRILRAFLRRCPGLDVVRMQDTELAGLPDPDVLEWAAGERRIVLSHDVKTLPKYAYERVTTGLPMPGLFVVHDWAPAGIVLDDLAILVQCSDPAEHEGRVIFIPM